MSRDHIVSVRLTDHEHETLAELAKQRGMSLSDCVRHLVRYATAPAPVTQPWPPGQFGANSITVATPANVIWNGAA